MKLIINNELSVLEFECKSCSKVYTINFDDIGSIPLWKFESCSRLCALTFSTEKFLTLKSKKEKTLNFSKI